MLRDLQRRSGEGYVSPSLIATIYAGLDTKDRAFEFLERARQERAAGTSRGRSRRTHGSTTFAPTPPSSPFFAASACHSSRATASHTNSYTAAGRGALRPDVAGCESQRDAASELRVGEIGSARGVDRVHGRFVEVVGRGIAAARRKGAEADPPTAVTAP